MWDCNPSIKGALPKAAGALSCAGVALGIFLAWEYGQDLKQSGFDWDQRAIAPAAA